MLDEQLRSETMRYTRRKTKAEIEASDDDQIYVYCNFPDNGTRQRALELLAELRGKRKAQVDVNHSGSVDSVVHVYLPSNGRDDNADDN